MTFERDFSRYEFDRFAHPSLEEFSVASEQSGIHSISYGDGNLDLYIEDRHAETTIAKSATILNRGINTGFDDPK